MTPEFRTGNGFDVHAFAPDRQLILGGVTIEHRLGLAGHSDADVLTHAIMDALLGAAGLGDIGRHFPDSDEAFRGADSIELLHRVCGLLSERGWTIAHVDATVIAEKPKLAGYVDDMELRLAAGLQIEPGRVNVKATTTEKLGFIGREEGIAALATATVYK